MRAPVVLFVLAGCTTSVDVADPAGDASVSTDTQSDGSAQLPPYEVISKFGHDVIRSVTVHKNGGEDRTVYIEVARITGIATTGPLANGARLIMQVNNGSGFVIEKVAGTWQYGTDTTTLTTQPNTSCSGCHLGAAEPGVFTAPSLRRLVATHRGEDITCAAGPGPQPCASTVYE